MKTSSIDDWQTSLSVVIPVYQGADCLETLCQELSQVRDDLRRSRIDLTEVIFVHDHGPDRSDDVLQKLDATNDWVRVVWLTRNFGQHPATVAGIAATSSDWVVTMDEDGLHDPADIPTLLQRALTDGADLVYGTPANPPPHPPIRNVTSRAAKWIFRLLAGDAGRNGFASYRLIDGPFARNLVAYCGHDVYVDVALGWAVSTVACQPVDYRSERRGSGGGSGYDLRKLLGHFRRLILSSGTKPLRLISGLGLTATTAGVLTAVVVVWMKLFGGVETEGWASVMITVAIFSGVIMMALGVIAEYLSLTATMAVGRPLYMVSGRPPRRESAPPVMLAVEAEAVIGAAPETESTEDGIVLTTNDSTPKVTPGLESELVPSADAEPDR